MRISLEDWDSIIMNSQQQKPSDVDKPENEEEDVEVKDIITDMLESVIEMISNEEMTKEMIEESIDEMEEDQSRDPNHPDFGTRYTDWSRNPEDYL